MSKHRILIVEDSKPTALFIHSALEKRGWLVAGIVNSGEDALRKIEADIPDLILMDVTLDGKMNGIETAEIIDSRFGIPIILLTSGKAEDNLDRAVKSGTRGCLIKPFKENDLYYCIESSISKISLEKKLKEREEEYITLVEQLP